ncbi:MAG: D-Ala-D-Ala carboxypeptidase family metallohydrolase [Actinomycetota bacterium]|nr:D-Ala-D-Ala carboxypeptidase family metallohydrolase [Actinomycetota bacterium]
MNITKRIKRWQNRRDKTRRRLWQTKRLAAEHRDKLVALEAERERARARRKKLRDNPKFKPELQGDERDRAIQNLVEEIENLGGRIDFHIERLDLFLRRKPEINKLLAERIETVERLRRKRERMKRERNGWSDWWHVREFDCRDKTPVPACIEPELRDHMRLTLDPMREAHGRGTCTSGHRHREYNLSIGSFPGSYHEYEQRCKEPATDLYFENGSPDDWARTARANLPNGNGGIGVYPASNFTHVDPRGYVSNWRG